MSQFYFWTDIWVTSVCTNQCQICVTYLASEHNHHVRHLEYNVVENLLHCLALGTKIRADKYFQNSCVLFLTTGDVGSLNRSRASADTLVSSCRSLCLAASSIKHQQNCNMYSQAPGDCSTWYEKCSVGEVSRLKTFVLQSNFFQGNRFSLKKLAKYFRYVLKYKNMETV